MLSRCVRETQRTLSSRKTCGLRGFLDRCDQLHLSFFSIYGQRHRSCQLARLACIMDRRFFSFVFCSRYLFSSTHKEALSAVKGRKRGIWPENLEQSGHLHWAQLLSMSASVSRRGSGCNTRPRMNLCPGKSSQTGKGIHLLCPRAIPQIVRRDLARASPVVIGRR